MEGARTYGRDPSRLDPIAPDWLVRILAPKKAPVPWLDMIRVALSITVPLAVGLLIAQPGLGIYAAMGSLVGAFGDKGGAFTARLARIAAGAVAAMIGLLVGRVTGGDGIVAVLAVGALAAISAVISTVSATLSFAGLQLLVYVAIAGGLQATEPLPVLLAAFLSGMAWAALMSLVASRVDPPRDEVGGAVADILAALARLFRTPIDDLDSLRTQRRHVTAAIGAAYDALAGARAHSAGRRADLRRLSGVATSAYGLLGASVTYLRGPSTDADRAAIATALDAVAEAVRQRRPADAVAAAAGLAVDADAAGVGSALTKVARALADPHRTDTDLAGNLPRTRPRRDWSALLLGRKARVFAARLGLTLMVAEVVRQLVPLEKPYWILLTAALVLKPDLGSVFARGVQRTLGTLIGVGLGIAIVQLVPHGGWTLVPVFVLAALFPLGASRNYGMLSTFLTPLVLLLLDFGIAVDRQLAIDRLLDTAIGAAVVLVVGYLAWPSTWRPRLGEHIAVAVEALAGYLRVAFTDQAKGPARRRTYMALSDVRAELQSVLAEPPPLSRQAAAWWPLIAQLERATDDLRHASLMSTQLHTPPTPADIATVSMALDDLGTALREHRLPADDPLPDAGPLADLAADLEGARRIANGPARP